MISFAAALPLRPYVPFPIDALPRIRADGELAIPQAPRYPPTLKVLKLFYQAAWLGQNRIVFQVGLGVFCQFVNVLLREAIEPLGNGKNTIQRCRAFLSEFRNVR